MGGRVAKTAANMGSMGAENAVVVAVQGGWRIANNVVGDWADKVMERAGEGVNVRPRVVVDGLDKMVERAMMYLLWRIWGVGEWGRRM